MEGLYAVRFGTLTTHGGGNPGLFWYDGLLETQNERKGEIVMAENIKWETEMDAALVRARLEKKPVLLDFFNPG